VYFTSLERISTLHHEQGKMFICCVSGCQENLIDG
jgi:hypothetical protein